MPSIEFPAPFPDCFGCATPENVGEGKEVYVLHKPSKWLLWLCCRCQEEFHRSEYFTRDVIAHGGDVKKAFETSIATAAAFRMNVPGSDVEFRQRKPMNE
jgi:hypothetical protein